MKVLLCLTDLYSSTGGGQTVYRQIVNSSPQIDFFYFVDSEILDAQRPSNAYPIKLKSNVTITLQEPPPFPYLYSLQLRVANQIARSVADQSFDIIDLPDFNTYGFFLKSAFSYHNVTFKKIVLALHGNISDSIYLNWDLDSLCLDDIKEFERLQYQYADEVYGISKRYINLWNSRFDRKVRFINPMSFVKAESEILKKSVFAEKPSLFCIGRSERRKGNDIFVELVKWLRADSIDTASHIGPPDYSFNGSSSEYLIKLFAEHRDLQIDYYQTLEPSQLREIFSKKSIVILPVRFDTLNLVALEALFSGCPLAVSTKAGVCDYLDEFYPGIPYIKIDLDNLYGSVKALQGLIDEYDKFRNQLKSYLELNNKSQPPPDFNALYSDFLSNGQDTKLCKIYSYIEKEHNSNEILREVLKRILSINFVKKIIAIRRSPFSFLKNALQGSRFIGDPKFVDILIRSLYLRNQFQMITNLTVSTRNKLSAIYKSTNSPIYRCNFFLEIANYERKLGNELIAVTYELRVLRLIGDDRFQLLPQVIDTLKKHNFSHEAEAAAAMFGSSIDSEKQVYRYLKSAYSQNLTLENKPWIIFEDHRSKNVTKVSVIVSLYNAADKLSNFLTALSCQTLIKNNQVEIILVDSGSPSDEKKVLDTFLDHTKLNVLYARSPERETIQAAWNRGIGEANGPYLVFLGVDETLYPDALEILATSLDGDSKLDWIMANSLVTAVDDSGCLNYDIMSYDRTGATKDHVYLETCYLSWVGGMYRKSIHERFGYYDESFGASGDTEFKNRILPYINVNFIPKVLGLFLNYPDGQTTASPKAEIEDLRAWYIHRTGGGIRYAYENRSSEDVCLQLYRSLGYRKSYCSHMSTDIQYGKQILDYLSKKNKLGHLKNLIPDLADMLNSLIDLEILLKPEDNRFIIFLKLIKIRYKFFRWQKKHRNELKSNASPDYKIFNDNRYEQHSWLWKSE